MRRDGKERHASSEAVIDLRKAMGMNQSRFAVLVLDVSVVTLARYETSHPPGSEVLLRLRDIAQEHGFPELSSRFETLYWESVRKDAELEQWVMGEASATREASGFLIASLNGEHEVSLGLSFAIVRAQLKWINLPKVRQKTIDAIAAFKEAVLESLPTPGDREYYEKLFAKLKMPQTAAPKKKSNRKSKGQT